jgi:thiamine-monophosphate kinase
MTSRKDNRTELKEFGEFGLIDHLTKNIKLKKASSIKGVGDDAAVIDNGNKLCVLSTDLLVEGVHFDLTYTPLKHLGYKAVVINVSDIVAMNAVPNQITVNISLSNRFSVEAIEEIYSGIFLACEKYNIDLVGGDTSSSVSGLYLSISILGEANKDEIVYRNTANKGDLVFVSGDLGAAYAGLLLLEREKQVFKDDPKMQPDLEGYDYILGRQLKPEARTDIQKVLNDKGILPTSMIDISDGLASDILQICKSSKLGCSIYEEKIPIDPTTVSTAEDFKIDPTTFALNGGEDYELLFTLRQSDYDKIKDVGSISPIGHMTEEQDGVMLISRNGTQIEIKAQGWETTR